MPSRGDHALSKVRVSDRALIRYLERADGFEIEKLRREIEKKVHRSAPTGASGLVVDGVTFVIVDNAAAGERVVTTVLDCDWLSTRRQNRA